MSKGQHIYQVINLRRSRTKVENYINYINRGKGLRDKDRIPENVAQTFNRIVDLAAKWYLKEHVHTFLRKTSSHNLDAMDLAMDHSKSYIGNKDQRAGIEIPVRHTNTISNHIEILKQFGMLFQIPSKSKTLLLVNHHLLDFNKKFKHLTTYFAPYFPISENSNNAFPIIGVGGIHSAEDALEKINAGADLIQVYTGFIYEGPRLIKAINKAILKESWFCLFFWN